MFRLNTDNSERRFLIEAKKGEQMINIHLLCDSASKAKAYADQYVIAHNLKLLGVYELH